MTIKELIIKILESKDWGNLSIENVSMFTLHSLAKNMYPQHWLEYETNGWEIDYWLPIPTSTIATFIGSGYYATLDKIDIPAENGEEYEYVKREITSRLKALLEKVGE